MEEWPEPGTPVRLVVKTWSGKVEHLGLALPPSGPKLVTVKLQNGYNVSFPESYVDTFELIDEMPTIEEAPAPSVPQDESLPLVHLIHTGGTIASKVDYATDTDEEAIDLIAERLRTPLQIEMHLTLAFEQGFRLGAKPVTAEIVEQVLSAAPVPIER